MSDLARKAIGLGKRPALVLVDMIRGFTDPECPLGSECTAVIAANKKLLDAFRAAKLPVFFTTVVFRSADQGKVFRRRLEALNLLQPDSDWIKVDPALAPLAGEPVIEKTSASGFFGTDLATHLRLVRADSLVITGLTTSGCVRATVVDGLQYDYPVVVPREAVGDRNQMAHEANCFDMHAKYAEVQGLAEVLAAIPNQQQEKPYNEPTT